MARIDIETAHNIVLQFELSALSERVIAYTLDLIIISVYISLISAALGGLSSPDFLNYILIIPVMFLYHLSFEFFNNGQSLGKYFMKIRVISLDGHQLTYKSILLRWALRLVDIFSSFGLIAILSILSSPRNQRLGDIVAGTAVIHLKRNTSKGINHLQEIQLIEHQVTYPSVTMYNDQDILLVKESLKRSHTNSASKKMILDLAKQIKSDLKIDQPINPQKLLTTIIEDYVYLTR